LKWIAEGGSQVSVAPASAAKGLHTRWRGALLCVVSLLLAAVTGLVVCDLKPLPPQLVSRTVITLPPGQRLAGLDQPAVALSPDGTHLAYVAIQGGKQQLYFRAIDNLAATPIPGTDGAVNPFFSPDSQWLGFFLGNRLKKVSVSGGPRKPLAMLRSLAGPVGAVRESSPSDPRQPQFSSKYRRRETRRNR
jgi:eukaryotic-like serine/threonine-protein kinase